MKTHISIIAAIMVLFSSYAIAGTWTTLDKPGASVTLAYGIDGSNIVGWYHQNGWDHSFLYNGSTWTTIDVPGQRGTYAQGISGSSIVGYCVDNSFNYRGFAYNGSTWSTFSAPGAEMTFAYAIEGNDIVGRYKDAATGNYYGFLYNGSTWTTLRAPGAIQTEALGISGGKIYGFYQDSSQFCHGFIYDGTTWTTLDVPGGMDGNAPGDNPTFLYDGDGSNLVGYYFDSSHDYTERGFLYNNSTWTPLDMPGANQTWAYGISGNKIVGEYFDSSFHSFIYTISEPGTPPIADAGSNQVAYAWIDCLAEVTLDGSGSYDDDWDELTYLWRWSIDGNDYEANGVNPTIELPVGQHTIELVVNDGYEDSEPNYVVITVVEPIEGTLWIASKVIHRRCEQKRIMTILRLPEGITRDQIDNNSMLLLYPGEVEAVRLCVIGGRHASIFGFFDRDEILEAIGGIGPMQVYIVGQLKTGQYFYGSDTMRIINPGRHRPKCNMRDWFHHRGRYHPCAQNKGD